MRYAALKYIFGKDRRCKSYAFWQASCKVHTAGTGTWYAYGNGRLHSYFDPR